MFPCVKVGSVIITSPNVMPSAEIFKRPGVAVVTMSPAPEYCGQFAEPDMTVIPAVLVMNFLQIE
jgi:hypothetical protein